MGESTRKTRQLHKYKVSPGIKDCEIIECNSTERLSLNSNDLDEVLNFIKTSERKREIVIIFGDTEGGRCLIHEEMKYALVITLVYIGSGGVLDSQLHVHPKIQHVFTDGDSFMREYGYKRFTAFLPYSYKFSRGQIFAHFFCAKIRNFRACVFSRIFRFGYFKNLIYGSTNEKQGVGFAKIYIGFFCAQK